ncbi:MAG: type III-B CRISPR module-associated Cmr3 family protein [Verrucomicrobiota bacterium]
MRGYLKGNWLPSWIDQTNGDVMLLDGPGENAARRRRVPPGKPIAATLVAAVTGKSLPVTGWALPNGTDRDQGGAKSTHLAVPAGSIYYFECDSAEAATTFAAALNWHGTSPGTDIQNRRSTLMGEKGFGLGVCGTWKFHPCSAP